MLLILQLGKISHGKIKDASPYNLYDELRSHLFQGKKERKYIVVEQGHFQAAFSCFQNFELQVRIYVVAIECLYLLILAVMDGVCYICCFSSQKSICMIFVFNYVGYLFM